MMKQQAYAVVGLPGVVEDGAHGEIGQEPGRPFRVRKKERHVTGSHNCQHGPARESDKPIVAKKSRNGDGAKGLCSERALVERRGEPLV